MREVIQNEKYGTIEFTEGNIIANRTITINGQSLQKVSNKKFLMNDGTEVNVTGSMFTGVKLQIGSDVVAVTNSAKWYEIAIYIAGLVIFFIWSNSITLCSIIPMIGGFIGAFLYCIPAILGFNFSVKQKNPALKLVITLCSVLVGLILCVIVGVLFVAALS